MPVDTEFFVLVPKFFGFAKEDTEISDSLSFTPAVTAPVSTVTAATNANPVAITTAAAHGLRTGMLVYVTQLVGNTSPNGQWWPVTVTSTTAFTIPVAGNGAWTSGGLVIPNETAAGTPDLIGAAYNERDMLAVNTGVVLPPTITSISPTSCAAGAATFTLTVNGTNFTSAGVVRWNATALTTTFVSSTQLTATVTGSLVAAATAACITVSDVGGISNSKSFLVSGGGAANYAF